MKTVSVEEVKHDLEAVLARVVGGETLAIVQRDQILAHLEPAPPPAPESRQVEMPDFMARLRADFGDKVTPDSAPIFEYMRQDAGSSVEERAASERDWPLPPSSKP